MNNQIEQNKKQQDSLHNIAHQNFINIFECVALIANLREDLGRKLDYVLNESTENKLSDSQIRLKLVEIKSLKETINYVLNPKSITRSGSK